MFWELAPKIYENKIIINHANISKVILWLMDRKHLINYKIPLFIKDVIIW